MRRSLLVTGRKRRNRRGTGNRRWISEGLLGVPSCPLWL